jgi:hypothetical protein
MSIDFSQVRNLAFCPDGMGFGDGGSPFTMAGSICPSLSNFTVVLGPNAMESLYCIRVPRLTEIDVDNLVLSSGFSRIKQCFSYYVESAQAIRNEFRDASALAMSSVMLPILSSNCWAKVNFEVSLLTWEKVQDEWFHERVALPPVHIEPNNKRLTYFIHRPMAVFPETKLYHDFGNGAMVFPGRIGGRLLVATPELLNFSKREPMSSRIRRRETREVIEPHMVVRYS